MPTVAVLGEAVRAKLNDVGAQRYTDDVLLPHFKSAWMILQSKMRSAGIAVTRDSGVVLTVPAGVTNLTTLTTPALPTDLIGIIEIHEKSPGESDEFYKELDDVTFLPDIPQGNQLNYYAWTEGRLEFVGCTADRTIRIRYIRYLTEITASSVNITVAGVEDFLIHKTGALAARYIGQNPTRADELDGEAARARDEYLNTEVKGKQGAPVLRRPYGFSRRNYKWRTR